MRLGEILGALPTMSASDRARLRAALEVLGSSKSGDEHDQDDQERREDELRGVYALLVQAGEEEGIAFPPFGVAARHRSFSAFRSVVKDVIRFVDRVFNPTDETHRRAGIQLVCRTVIRYVTRTLNLAPVPGIVLTNFRSYAATFEREYPGYAASRLGSFILNRQR